MTRQERIEKLKQNKIVFGEMEQEDKDLLRELINKSYSNMFVLKYGGWDMKDNYCLLDHYSYRIAPDYQEKPEPKVIRCEVSIRYDDLSYYDEDNILHLLTDALHNPNFIGFEYEDGIVSIDCRMLQDGKPAAYPKYVLFSEVQE